MKIISRKTFAAMIAGTFIMAAAASPFIVQASEIEESPAGQHQKGPRDLKNHQVNPEKAAQRLSDVFAIDKATILKYNADGMSFRDIGKAAFLANASGKSLADVISHKTPDNKWKDVAITLGITKEQMRTGRQNMAANNLNKKIGLDKQTTIDLLHEGYHVRDIGMASELAKNTSRPIIEVLSLKKINNKWSDVATTLGVDNETFKKDAQELGYGFKHRGHREYKGNS
ncbi:MAG: hypothetical protein H6Q68_2988 [Firmicutes bacterium]|nr:hypothetical protein [Bacillota bacterium]